ncbi:MAG: ArsR/SmtB family transcription factor [Devosia sp.]
MSNPRDISTIVPDAVALKALAHPMRLRILSLLRIDGPATATSLAARLGLNSGATSYHLRNLAQHGFIEEDPGHDSRRDRWWRARHESTSFHAEGTPEQVDAGAAFAQAALTQQVQMMQRAQEEFLQLPAEWQAAADTSDFIIALTPEQAKALKDQILQILWQAMRDAPPAIGPLPLGLAAYTVMLHAFPYPGKLVPPREDEP